MVEITAIASVLSSLKAAKDIAEAMITLRDSAAFQSKVIEFQSKILDAQSSAFSANEERTTLVETVRQLEKQIADLKAWDREKERYELKEFASHAMAYEVKESMRGTEPVHQICTTCYEHAKK